MAYAVEFTPHADRDFRRLSRDVQTRLASRIDALGDDPRPAAARKLTGTDEELYRIRVGDYRIIYQILDQALLVLIVRLGHRRDVYQNLPSLGGTPPPTLRPRSRHDR